MPILLTPKAAEEISRVIREQQRDERRVYLRVCYFPRAPREKRFRMDLPPPDEAAEPSDHSWVHFGVVVGCDHKSYHYVDGITIDFAMGPDGAGFTVTRPPGRWPAAEPFAEPWLEEALRTVIDPEIGVNIVDLGLIYETQLHGDSAVVTMTMTTPACPMTEMIRAEVERSIKQRHPEITQVDVRLVWQPPWTPEMISDDCREQMGWK